jgi:hypothetical protein
MITDYQKRKCKEEKILLLPNYKKLSNVNRSLLTANYSLFFQTGSSTERKAA